MSKVLSKRAALVLLIIGVAILLIVPIPFPAEIGTGDFRAYWSSSFLLAHGQDFSDLSKMDYVERTLTGWNEPFTMQAWFASTGNVILLPYTLFSFTRATFYWFLTNIIVVFLSALLIWHNTKIRVWIPLVTVFGFSMTLLSLNVGQVNTLVLLGLALFLFFSELRQDYAAGASLVLTTIKAHLVILTLPLLLLDIVRRKQWRVLAGFIGALIGCALILYVFYPAWPVSFWHLVTSGMTTIRETPTITGLFVVAGEPVWGKWIWVVTLFLSTVIWWRYGKEWDRRTLVDVSILVGMVVSPLGWSYDQVMLLFPLLRVLEWMVNGCLAKKDTIAITLVLIIANAITFYERTILPQSNILTPSEVWFFWVPLVAAAIYGFAWQRKQVKRLAQISHFTPLKKAR